MSNVYVRIRMHIAPFTRLNRSPSQGDCTKGFRAFITTQSSTIYQSGMAAHQGLGKSSVFLPTWYCSNRGLSSIKQSQQMACGLSLWAISYLGLRQSNTQYMSIMPYADFVFDSIALSYGSSTNINSHSA